jgi:hypothetical protein
MLKPPAAAAAPVMPDLSKFKCYRFQADGSLYYGEVAFYNAKTGQMVRNYSVEIIFNARPNLERAVMTGNL